jgi:EamA domain-containing membrane protein RarD
MMYQFSKWLEPGRRIWLVFAAVFLLTQAVNIEVMFVDYTGWEAFGFPISYYHYHADYEYSYFNAVNLILDMVIMFIVARIILFGYEQLTKYRIIK